MAGLKVKARKIPYQKGRIALFGMTRKQLIGGVATAIVVGVELFLMWGKVNTDILMLITFATVTLGISLFVVEQNGMPLLTYFWKSFFETGDKRYFRSTTLYKRKISSDTSKSKKKNTDESIFEEEERGNDNVKKYSKKGYKMLGKKSQLVVAKSNWESVPFLEVYSTPYDDVDNVALFQVVEDVYSIAFSFTDIDYTTIDDVEKRKKYEAYKQIINSLNKGITYQEFLMNQKIEDVEYTTAIVPSLDNARSDRERQFAEEVGNVQKDFIRKANKKSSKKSTLVCLSYKLQSSIDNVDCLFAQYKELKKMFEDLGSSVKLLSVEEVLRIMHSYYHPFDNQEFFITNNYNVIGRDIKHYVAPSLFNFKPRYVEMGNAYTAVMALCLTGQEAELSDSLVSCLLDNSYKVTVSKFLRREDKEVAMKQLRAEEGALLEKKGRRERENAQSGMTGISWGLERKVENVTNLLGRLSQAENELFCWNMFVSVSAQTTQELEEIVEYLKQKVYSLNKVRLNTIHYAQDLGLHSMLPLATNFFSLSNKDNFDIYLLTEALGVAVPFASKIFYDPNGVNYGLDANSNLIVISKREEMNSNGFVLGSSGGGKSMISKLEDVQLYFKYPNEVFMILDPQGEYRSILNGIDGEEIILAPSSNTKINIFEVSQEELETGFDLDVKTEFIMSVCETMKRKELTSEELGLISECVSALYEKMLSLKDVRYCPTLNDFHALLKKRGEKGEKDAHNLALAISTYATPTSMLSGRSTINFSKRYTIINTKECNNLWKAVAMTVILSMCEQRLNYLARRGLRVNIKVDEFDTFFVDAQGKPMAQTATFFKNCYQRIRKLGSSIQGITQNLSDLLQSHQARAMLNNATFITLLHLEQTELEEVDKLYHLSKENQEFLEKATSGQGIIICGKKVVQFDNRISTESEVYRLLQTTQMYSV